MAASDKKPGRAIGHLDKMNDELKEDIKKYLCQNVGEKTISIAELLRKHHISRNTFSKYAKLVSDK